MSKLTRPIARTVTNNEHPILVNKGGLIALSVSRQWKLLIEATMGFEPMIRVLQTLALPLGHVAGYFSRGEYFTLCPMKCQPWALCEPHWVRKAACNGGFLVSGRWDSNPRPSPWQGDILPTEPRPQTHLIAVFIPDSGRTVKGDFFAILGRDALNGRRTILLFLSS